MTTWGLYHTETDRAELHDLAAEHLVDAVASARRQQRLPVCCHGGCVPLDTSEHRFGWDDVLA